MTEVEIVTQPVYTSCVRLDRTGGELETVEDYTCRGGGRGGVSHNCGAEELAAVCT
jgi:hypothetical protein